MKKLILGVTIVLVTAAAGHTPCSQIIITRVRTGEGVRDYVFAGDVANHIDGIDYDIPKPWLYRWFLVPEDETRMRELRHFVRGLREAGGMHLLVSHDQRQIERSGLEAWDG